MVNQAMVNSTGKGFGRMQNWKKDEQIKLPLGFKSAFGQEDVYSVNIQMDSLQKKGRRLDKKIAVSDPHPLNPATAFIVDLKNKNYIQEGSYWVLYEYPPTVMADWKGSVSFSMLINGRNIEFRPIAFEFKKGYADSKPGFTAEWQANGFPIE